MARISTRRAYAYGKIVQSIKTGVFKPGDRLIESNLCEMLGLSRVPVREALFQLASEGLVEHAPGLGAIVSCPDRQEILDLYELREVLEGHTAYRAAEVATLSDIEQLEDSCRRMHAMLRSAMDAHEWGDQHRATMFSVDMDFHDMLSRIAGNARITAQIQTINVMWKIIVFDPRFPAASNWRMRTWAWGYHTRIVRAIKQRNPQAARAAMIAHISVSRPFAIRAQAALWQLAGRI
jgi:DNA-binding GntR family transcriptional regulator